MMTTTNDGDGDDDDGDDDDDDRDDDDDYDDDDDDDVRYLAWYTVNSNVFVFVSHAPRNRSQTISKKYSGPPF